jgi:FKBP-type peptidyl-prolyl cis-trans isomerase
LPFVSCIAGDNVKVHYTGWLDGFDGKKKFDSSLDRGTPLEFAAGIGRVIPGWDEALLSMKVGTVREVIIPAKLGYGKRGAGGLIPPNATLYFRMDLIDTSPTGFVKGMFNKLF